MRRRRQRWAWWERVIAIIVFCGSATGSAFMFYGLYRAFCLVLG